MKIVKVSSSQGSLGKNIGTEKAPEKIVEDLKKMSVNEQGRFLSYEVDEVRVDPNNIEETNESIFEKEGDIFIGGDHSITYPLFKKVVQKNKNAGLIMFDAHPDCENNFAPPSHEDFIKVLIEEGSLKKDNLILIGIRNMDIKEQRYIREKRIKCYTMKELRGNIEETCDTIMELARGFDALYISIDIDVVDPSQAPGTGYVEPAGMQARDLIYFIQRIKLLKNLKRVDLVEVNPEKDINQMTVKLAAKIIAELI
ncbi:MAG: arginase family protein [Candidatus Nanoarchaeia archaeon]